MFCEKCRIEFVEGIARCSDCGSRLVEKLPEEEKPRREYRELVEVFATWKNIEASFVKSLLDSSGVESFVHNLYYPSITPVGTGAVPIRIMVPADDEENRKKAEEIVEEYLRNG